VDVGFRIQAVMTALEDRRESPSFSFDVGDSAFQVGSSRTCLACLRGTQPDTHTLPNGVCTSLTSA